MATNREAGTGIRTGKNGRPRCLRTGAHGFSSTRSVVDFLLGAAVDVVEGSLGHAQASASARCINAARQLVEADNRQRLRGPATKGALLFS